MSKPDSCGSDGLNVRAVGWAPMLWLVLGVASAIWLLGLRSWLPIWRGIPNTAVTTLCFLAAAAVAKAGVPARYQWSMVVGLGFSALGDAFLMQTRDYFVAGLGSFLVAHLCYLWALTSDCPLAQPKLPFAVYGVAGVALVFWLWPHVPRTLRLPVALYAATIMTMAAQATSRALSMRALGATLAATGSALFVVSDAALAVRRFAHPLGWGHFIVLATYFGAQASLALSVVFHGNLLSGTQPKVNGTVLGDQ